MGTDVHMHLEIKINGRWEHYGAPQVSRSYNLFGLLGEVRGNGPAVGKPKGMPTDPSTVTAFDFARMGVDAHTPSWFSAQEIDAFEQAWALDGEHMMVDGRPYPAMGRDIEHNILRTYLFGNGWAGFSRWPNDRPKGLEDVRWVFWFDS